MCRCRDCVIYIFPPPLDIKEVLLFPAMKPVDSTAAVGQVPQEVQI